jgi:hypothetical protein
LKLVLVRRHRRLGNAVFDGIEYLRFRVASIGTAKDRQARTYLARRTIDPVAAGAGAIV